MPTVLAVLMAVLSLGSQTAPDDSTEKASASSARALQAEPATGSIVVDGHLDEEAWQSAPVATDFRQFEPDEGAPATHPTEVRILYGENNLYIGAYLYDSEPSEIEDALGRRDSYNRADWFTVYIDSHLDRRTAYAFAVNAAGVQLDGLQNDRAGGFRRGPDTSWDAIWTSAARVTEDGWITEMQIPYAMLRFSKASEQTWGVQFQRRIPRLSERAEWILIPRTERGSGTVSQYGLLTGMQNIEPRRDVQIRPYTVSSLETQEGEPQGLEASGDVDVGADLRIGLAPNLTLDATVNPDFGQVESDPAVLNLSAFETFFDEKRPFFVEGAQIFDFDIGRRRNLLYTRRIGAQAPIVGAAKVSGRTAEGLSLGVMGATTGDGFQPRRHYSVARLQQEFATYSSAGGILTAFNAPGEQGRRTSLSGGADWDLRFQDNTYGLEGWTSFTRRTQLAEDDETNTATETGFAGSMEAERLRGAWTYDLGLTVFDDRFDPNDLGQLRRNNFFRVSGGLDHEINGGNSFGPFQRADAGLSFGHSWSYRERLSQGLGFFFRSNWTLKSFQRIELDFDGDYLFGGYDLFETRGLGPRAQPREFGVSVEFETDERRAWQFEPQANVEFRSDGAIEYGLDLGAEWSVGSRLTLSGGIEFEHQNNATEWASNETFAFSNGTWQIGRQSTSPEELGADDYEPVGDGARLEEILDPVAPYDEDGRYYVPVFGARDTRSLDVSLRSNITFTPNLSLQLYGQLFAAKGQYERFQILQNPDDLARFSSYPKRHDFSIRSFISNVVLRWEFQPGSRLYLVWSQSRRQDVDNPYFFDDPVSSPYETPTSEHLFNTFNLFPSNTFLVKLDYTFLW